MDVRLLIVAYLIICIAAATPYRSRKNSQPTYDQKQTGEYNIQLHLKDFEVVALVADSAFAEGDYDYQYDYSDITLKPSTARPSTTSKPPTTQNKTSQTTTTTTSTTLSESRETPILTTRKSTAFSTVSVTSTLPSVRLDNELERNITKEEIMKQQSTVKTEIIVKPVESLTIIDKNDNFEENLPLVVHRKCASGFTRDKNGRCRKVRRPPPQFSFGISRLANLASKLRGTNDSQTSESTSIDE